MFYKYCSINPFFLIERPTTTKTTSTSTTAAATTTRTKQNMDFFYYGSKNYQRMGMIRLTTPNMQYKFFGILKFKVFGINFELGIGRWLQNYQLNEVLKEAMIIFMNWSVAGCKVVNKNRKNLRFENPI